MVAVAYNQPFSALAQSSSAQPDTKPPLKPHKNKLNHMHRHPHKAISDFTRKPVCQYMNKEYLCLNTYIYMYMRMYTCIVYVHTYIHICTDIYLCIGFSFVYTRVIECTHVSTLLVCTGFSKLAYMYVHIHSEDNLTLATRAPRVQVPKSKIHTPNHSIPHTNTMALCLGSPYFAPFRLTGPATQPLRGATLSLTQMMPCFRRTGLGPKGC